jgi:diacylglycerol kinase family enzyme
MSTSDNGAAHTAPFVVSGGDGTLFHLLQKLRPPLPTITLIPTGRGNALARDLRHQPQPVTIDLIQVEAEFAGGERVTYRCASSVAFGYPTTITRHALAFRFLRRLSYAAASAVTMPRRQLFQLQYGQEPPQTLSLTGILINNTRHAGGFVAFPTASCHDGQADFMELRAHFLSQMAHNLSAMSKWNRWNPARTGKLTEARIHPESPQELMLDGELIANVAAIRLRVLPAALSCSVQPNA